MIPECSIRWGLWVKYSHIHNTVFFSILYLYVHMFIRTYCTFLLFFLIQKWTEGLAIDIPAYCFFHSVSASLSASFPSSLPRTLPPCLVPFLPTSFPSSLPQSLWSICYLPLSIFPPLSLHSISISILAPFLFLSVSLSRESFSHCPVVVLYYPPGMAYRKCVHTLKSMFFCWTVLKC